MLCPECGNKIPARVMFCNVCGIKLDVVDERVSITQLEIQSTEQQSEEQQLYGDELSDTEQEDGLQTDKQDDVTPHQKPMKWYRIIAGIYMVVCFFCSLFMLVDLWCGSFFAFGIFTNILRIIIICMLPVTLYIIKGLKKYKRGTLEKCYLFLLANLLVKGLLLLPESSHFDFYGTFVYSFSYDFLYNLLLFDLRVDFVLLALFLKYFKRNNHLFIN